MIRRVLLRRFLEHLHATGALSCPPSETWIDAFLEDVRGGA